MSNRSPPRVSEAVVLMAGAGTRLRGENQPRPKPLMTVLGRPLISYILETIADAGIEKVHAVVGYESALVMAQTRPLISPGLRVEFVHNAHWEKQNGVSVLAVAGQVSSPFLLTMCDHLFDQAIPAILMERALPDEINVGIDRKLDSIFELDDAMKVRTHDNRVVTIGKTLASFDAVDIGMFVCAETLFDYLTAAVVNGDCSLSDGIRMAAAGGKAGVIDVGEAWWQDVDTPEMLARAEAQLLVRPERRRAVAGPAETGRAGER